MKYQRILLKLSGEALMGDQTHGIDPVKIDTYAKEIKRYLTKALKLPSSLGAEIFLEGSLEQAKEWIVYRLITWGCSPQS